MADPCTRDSELGLFSPIKPFNEEFLNRGIHHIYFEETGNPDGIPVMFLHGGPGAGCAPAHRRCLTRTATV